MTVIAWDGRTLAADKRATSSGLARTVTKIHKIGDTIVAASGNASQDALMVEWVRQGCKPEAFPDSQKDKDDWSTVVVVDASGVRYYERTPYPILVEDAIWATGSGRDFALAAMHLGKSSVEAVAVASEFQIDCGNGCDSYSVQQ
jgi:20S proteasome alpha/beta subunit